jgi:acetoacetyl-CoA synthetase
VGTIAGGALAEGTVLWVPSPERIANAPITAFSEWLSAAGFGSFPTYGELWRWSVADLEGFWEAVRRYFEMGPASLAGPVLVRGHRAEGARWFPDLRLNYVDAIDRHPDDDLALIARDEDGDRRVLTYGQLRAAAGAAAGLRRLGVTEGDRVAAVVPNGVEAAAGLLAVASIGAVWSSCAPELGAEGMIDRFSQIEPKVLLAAAGYRYGGQRFDLDGTVASLERSLAGLRATVVVPGPDREDLGPAPAGARRLPWDELLAVPASLVPVAVPFEHPLWILCWPACRSVPPSSPTTEAPASRTWAHCGGWPARSR